MIRNWKNTIRFVLCLVMAIAITGSAVPAEAAEAAQAQTPKLYSANAELGAYLDRALLNHQAEIVIYTNDRSLFQPASPTMETNLEYCSLMLYGIKHDKNIRTEPVIESQTEVIPPSTEGEGATIIRRDYIAYYKVTLRPTYRYSVAKDRAFYNKVQSAAKKARKKKGVKNRAKYINSFIAKKVKYNIRTPYHNTAYAAMMKGKASCQGYADLFTLISRQAGLNVDTVCGFAWLKNKGKKTKRNYHAWNVIKSGKKWVQIDPTFNDAGKKSRTKFFMIKKKKFNKNHSLDTFYNNAKWKNAHPLK